MFIPKNRHLILFAILMPVMLVLSGCDAFSSDDDESGIVTFTGQVLNSSTNNPVENAFIQVSPYDLLFETDAEGRFTFEVEIDSTMEISLTAAADGFSAQTLPIFALAGRTISVPPFNIIPVVAEEATSGRPSNIILLDQTLSTVGVRESGSEELSRLTFQLADSVGNPVILDQSVDVRFRFGVHPDGGEFLAPTVAATDNNGVTFVNLSSGTKAGVVQIIAETDVDGRTIRSQPVAVTIHGGLPDQTHFSLGPVVRNFPGLNTLGLENRMSVIVGDKYSNPVRKETAVYFDTSHGVIEGSTLTDVQGRGSVALISANPLPADGIAHIRAYTADDQQQSVSSVTPVVFSGTPVIYVTPGSARVNQVYQFTVTDYNGNPLAPGTGITVDVTGTAIQVGGHTSVQLDDTGFSGGIDYEHVVRGSGITEFTFVVAEDIDPDNPETPAIDAIVITSSGPNGSLEVVLSGGGEPYSRTDGVQMTRLPDGRFKFEATEDFPVETR